MSDSPSHKLGDKVATVIEAVGLKRAPCRRCRHRQAALNEARTLSDVVKAVLVAPKEESPDES